MLLEKGKSCLLLIDVQEKLTPLVMDSEKLISNCQWLLRLASELDVPILVSEQYSKGLGGTVDSLRKIIPGDIEVDKIYFSCYRDQTFLKNWQNINKKQAVIAGIETHVCVLQTALQLIQNSFEVFVVVDAVSSRHTLDKQYALDRMRAAGVQLVTREMVFFEWIEQAGTEVFKALSKAFL